MDSVNLDQAKPDEGSPGASEDTPLEAGEVSSGELREVLEAILMVVTEPVSTRHLSQVLGVPESLIDRQLRALAADYRGETGTRRGFELREAGEGWRIYSSPRLADAVAAFVTWGQSSRLSGPALETLAVIAYRQPVTRSQIAEIRGPGFMVAVEFTVPGGRVPDPDFTNRVKAIALERGLILLTCGVYANAVRFLAPITIQDAVFVEAMDILEASMVAAAETVPA